MASLWSQSFSLSGLLKGHSGPLDELSQDNRQKELENWKGDHLVDNGKEENCSLGENQT